MSLLKLGNAQGIDLLLGGGFVRGAGHLGLCQFLLERNVVINNLIGVSIGALFGTVLANGCTPITLGQSFVQEMSSDLFHDLAEAGWPSMNPFQWKEHAAVDLLPIMQHLIDRFRMKPHPAIKIVAYDIKHARPYVFSGSDYDLAVALAASCAIPGVMRPVPLTTKFGTSHLLVDGGIYVRKASLASEGAIVSRLDDSAWGKLLMLPRLSDTVVDAGHPAVSVFSKVTQDAVDAMIEFGYARAAMVLTPLLGSRIPVSTVEAPRKFA